MNRRMNMMTATLAFLLVMFSQEGKSFGSVDLAETNRLPKTDAVLSDLNETARSIDRIEGQLKQLRTNVQSARRSVRNAAGLTKKVKSVENKIYRIQREVDSLSRIPQLKIFKPVASGLKSMGSKIKQVRKKADHVRKTKLEPAEKKLRELELEITGAQRKLSQIELQVVSAKTQLSSFRSIVVRNGYRRVEVAAIEGASSAARRPISDLRKTVQESESATRDIVTQVSRIRSITDNINRYAGGLSKVESKLNPIDKKAKSVSKVMSKSISFKIPFTKKRITVSVRKILTAPGDVAKAAIKPLTAIAKKLLKPLTKKVKFDINPPKEIQQLSQAFDSLQKMKFQLDSQLLTFRTKIRRLDSAEIKNGLSKLIRAAKR